MFEWRKLICGDFPVLTVLLFFVWAEGAFALAEQMGEGREHRMIYSCPVSRHEPETEAAQSWDEAMPTGNGRVGALVFGEVERETVILNHDSLFFTTKKPTLPDVSENLSKIRELMRRGRYNQAGGYYRDKVDVDYDHQGSDSYHPAFNLTVDMSMQDPPEEIHRTVDFETGEVSVTWRVKDVTYLRKLFVSRKDDAVVMKIGASEPGKVSCKLGVLPTGLKREELGNGKNVRVPRFPTGRVAKIRLDEVPVTYNVSAKRDMLELVGRYDEGGKYHLVGGDEYGGCVYVKARGGNCEMSDLQFDVDDADEVLVLVKLFANEKSEGALGRVRSALKGLPADYEKLLSRHSAIHGDLFGRVELDLGARESNRNLPNEKLYNEAHHGQGLNALFERMFDFGRYALICSSGTEGMPANLQGIWNGVYGPPWAADYHNDMNIQMNYWQALPGNLAELTLPYFDYYEGLMDDFRTNAWRIAGCRGILAPISGTSHGLAGLHWSSWTAGAGWLAELFYDYWLFTGDREFLKERAIPFMKEAALLYEDYLVEGDGGRYVFIPSMSPENVPGNTESFCTINATMDIAVARELLSNLIEGCRELGIEEAGVKKWRRMLAKSPRYLINEEGALKEWSHPDFEENYEHRHMSHLYPVYPSLEVTREKRPELFEACRVAMQKKLEEFEYPCCWSYVQAACTFARLEKAEEALQMLEIVARGYTLPNLFTTLWLYHWRPPMYQFEAASGIPAAIMEMLLYSEPGIIKLLPALPEEWPEGHITGLSARGGFEVDIYWEGGDLSRAEITSLSGGRCTVRYRAREVEFQTEPGETYKLGGNLQVIP